MRQGQALPVKHTVKQQSRDPALAEPGAAAAFLSFHSTTQFSVHFLSSAASHAAQTLPAFCSCMSQPVDPSQLLDPALLAAPAKRRQAATDCCIHSI